MVARLALSSLLIVAILSTSPLLFGQQPAARKATAKPGATPVKPGMQPKFKAIFEPVNFTEDLELTDVFFVNELKGWVSGAAGTILHTKDGGDTWTVQLGGDPLSPLPKVHSLRFIDETHGWAILEDKKLLRTTDGENWQEYGHIGKGYACNDYVCTSLATVVQILSSHDGNLIEQSKDGGLTYQQVNPSCEVSLEIDGLRRKVRCVLATLHFVSPEVGYAVGATASEAGATGAVPAVVILKTTDGGGTWAEHAIVENVAKHYESWYDPQEIFFADENDGVLVLQWSKKLLTTSDGGRTWEARVAAVNGPVNFADPQVGWSFDIRSGGKNFSFTTNGGKLWTTRPLKFPAEVKAFSLPRRDRGYLVGDHGMIYRYRIVPITYTAKGMLDAPIMPQSTSVSAQADTKTLSQPVK